MPGLPTLLFTAALLAASQSAGPAPATDPESETITITGERFNRQQMRARSYAYIHKTLADTNNGQHARWFGSICPRVIGARPETAAMFIDRIVTAAAVLKLRVEPEGCRPNIAIWFTSDAKALMRQIADKSSRVFDSTSMADLRQLLNGDDPVRWFYDTRSEGESGQTIGEGSAAIGAQLGSTNAPNTNNNAGSTRMSAGSRVALIGATVIINVPRAEGQALEALAAQTVMLVLSRTRLRTQREASDSILTLFSPRPPETRPTDLSRVDEAFLVALYKADPNQWAGQQSALIVNAMINDLFKQRETGTP
ncbi:MAG: hypothetical protein RL490_953 [Pseudomonadota bacterium]